MELQIIGAGFGRCGTMSTKVALEKLGYPCHHMKDVLMDKASHLPLWKKVGEGDEEVLKEIFSGYTACLDFPGCYYYEKLMDWNPEAKVILSVRDSPEAWEKSARDTICHPTECPLQSELISLRAWIPHSWSYYVNYFGKEIYRTNKYLPPGVDLLDPKTDLKKVYSDWIKDVMSKVPKEKLLVFNVKEGWKPLCEFLGKPIPDEPFPRFNDTAEFKKIMAKQTLAIRIIKLVTTSMLIGTISYLGYRYQEQLQNLVSPF